MTGRRTLVAADTTAERTRLGGKAHHGMRALALGAALAFLACSSGPPVGRERLFLSVAHSSGGPAPVVCAASLYDEGLLHYGCGQSLWVTRLSTADLAAYHQLIRSSEWQSATHQIAVENHASRYADAEELHIQYRIGFDEFAVAVPVELLPAGAQPLLQRLHKDLARYFGRHYDNILVQP